MEATDVTGRRVGAAVIDFFVAVVILLLIGALIGNDAGEDASVSEQLGTLDRVAFLVVAFAYFFATELMWAQTIGKKVLGVRVVSADGSPAAPTAILIRNVVRLVDWLPLLYVVGAISLFMTGTRRQRVGDIAAKTRVVASDAPPDGPAPPPPPPADEDVIAQIMR